MRWVHWGACFGLGWCLVFLAADPCCMTRGWPVPVMQAASALGARCTSGEDNGRSLTLVRQVAQRVGRRRVERLARCAQGREERCALRPERRGSNRAATPAHPHPCTGCQKRPHCRQSAPCSLRAFRVMPPAIRELVGPPRHPGPRAHHLTAGTRSAQVDVGVQARRHRCTSQGTAREGPSQHWGTVDCAGKQASLLFVPVRHLSRASAAHLERTPR